jgi:chromosome segregation ATPase
MQDHLEDLRRELDVAEQERDEAEDKIVTLNECANELEDVKEESRKKSELIGSIVEAVNGLIRIANLLEDFSTRVRRTNEMLFARNVTNSLSKMPSWLKRLDSFCSLKILNCLSSADRCESRAREMEVPCRSLREVHYEKEAHACGVIASLRSESDLFFVCVK